MWHKFMRNALDLLYTMGKIKLVTAFSRKYKFAAFLNWGEDG